MERNIVKYTTDYLESLVHKRFDNLEDLKIYIIKTIEGYELKDLVDRDLEYIDGFLDYNIIGTLENGLWLCDFDIYYAKTRSGGMYITEVGYTFE